MYGQGKYSSTESAHCIKINAISKDIKDLILKSDPEIPRNAKGEVFRNNEVLQNKVVQAMNDLEIEGQKFEFEYMINYLGGFRWFWVCSGCKVKKLKLFKPAQEINKQQLYLCDTCHHLKSPSALLGPSSRYRDIVKPQRRMDKLRSLIRNSRRMSEEDLKKHMDEYEALKTKMEKSPTWRKFRFEMENTSRNPRR